MTTRGGKRQGAGRKPRLNAQRHNVILDNEVWQYLNRTGNASAKIQKLVEDEMAKNYTYEQIATDYELWAEYVDPGATMTREQFDAMTAEEKVEMQVKLFGADEHE